MEFRAWCDRWSVSPVLAMLALALTGIAIRFEEFHVASIGLESDVKKVAQDRDRPDSDIEQNIGHHARGHRFGHVVMAKSNDDECNLNKPGGHVSADRQQTKEARPVRR